MTDREKFNSSIAIAHASYNRTKDANAYLSSCLKAALKLMAEEHGHNKVSTVLSASSPVFEAVLDYGQEGFSCPVRSGHDVADFLSGLNSHIQARLRRDYYSHVEKHLPQSASNALSKLIDML